MNKGGVKISQVKKYQEMSDEEIKATIAEIASSTSFTTRHQQFGQEIFDKMKYPFNRETIQVIEIKGTGGSESSIDVLNAKGEKLRVGKLYSEFHHSSFVFIKNL